MAKYSLELKLEVINYCKENNCGSRVCARHFNIDVSTIKLWRRKYEKWGVKGLFKKKCTYDGNFKISVIEYMHKNNLSLRETMLHFNLSGIGLIQKWEHIYTTKGAQALLNANCEDSVNSNMSKNNKKNNNDVNEHLCKENEYLRMENEYLKKLNALVQKRIKHENKKK